MRFSLAQLRPAWLRLALLVAIGLAPMSGWSNFRIAWLPDPLSFVVAWAAYSVFIWLLTLLNVGFDRMLAFLSAPFVLALTTCLLGASMRKLFPFLAGGATQEEMSLRMVTLFFSMISLIPYALLVVNSFSAAGLARRVSQLGGARRRLGVHGALALRVLQHVGEVFSELLIAWREENPARLLPRHRSDWHRSRCTSLYYLDWFRSAVADWTLACLVHSLEPLPLFAHEIGRLTARSPAQDERSTES
jgi:hypothetical protein